MYLLLNSLRMILVSCCKGLNIYTHLYYININKMLNLFHITVNLMYDMHAYMSLSVSAFNMNCFFSNCNVFFMGNSVALHWREKTGKLVCRECDAQGCFPNIVVANNNCMNFSWNRQIVRIIGYAILLLFENNTAQIRCFKV